MMIQSWSSAPEHIPAVYSDVVASFLDVALRYGDFIQIARRDEIGARCGLFLKGRAAEQWGEDLPCLVTALDELGNWTVVTLTGRVVQFLSDEVA